MSLHCIPLRNTLSLKKLYVHLWNKGPMPSSNSLVSNTAHHPPYISFLFLLIHQIYTFILGINSYIPASELELGKTNKKITKAFYFHFTIFFNQNQYYLHILHCRGIMKQYISDVTRKYKNKWFLSQVTTQVLTFNSFNSSTSSFSAIIPSCLHVHMKNSGGGVDIITSDLPFPNCLSFTWDRWRWQGISSIFLGGSSSLEYKESGRTCK